MTTTKLPSASEVREALLQLGPAQMQTLANLSGVSLTTLMRIQTGATPNPGIETVRKFLPHIRLAARYPSRLRDAPRKSTQTGIIECRN
jgi:transcriptional regulator with XRE-family HTH domain